MLLDLLDDLDPAGLDREVRADRMPLPPGWRRRAQGPGDLGARIGAAVRDAEQEGIERLVVLGADAPLLPDGLVEDAFRALESAALAIAPAEDGGYVLIGFACGRVDAQALLRDIRWGTGAVLAATLRAAAGVKVRLLPEFWDVDRPEDLVRLRELAAQHPDRLRRVGAVLGQFQSDSTIA